MIKTGRYNPSKIIEKNCWFELDKSMPASVVKYSVLFWLAQFVHVLIILRAGLCLHARRLFFALCAPHLYIFFGAHFCGTVFLRYEDRPS